MKKLMTGLTLAAAVIAAPAMAYEAGDMVIRGGVTTVAPNADGEVIGQDVDVNNETQLGLTATYMLSKRLGVEVLAATPFTHTVSLQGLGDVVETKQLPPTVSVVYYLTEGSALKPYVGAGINYTTFFEDDGVGALAGTDVRLDNSWGLAVQLGADYELSDQLHLNASVRYIDIDTEVSVNGTKLPGKAEIDPTVFSVMVGYTF